MSVVDEAALLDRLGRLGLEEKVSLVTGHDFWSTVPLPGIGLRAMTLSDGPSGVRGPRWDERAPSLNLPSATSLASTWDVELAERYGAVSAFEARRKGVDIVLGPTINLHRSPLAGRHFECYSEDAVLTGQLAAGFVRGVQSAGVAATPKHYVGNDFETDRFTANVVVSERALHEVYLRAFEPAVREARAWLVMSAYNAVNGVTMSESPLLEDPLETDWGFDGVVVSDWGAVRSLASAEAAQDLEMPGPAGAWGPALLEAVLSGTVTEDALDGKVLRILRLAARVGALDGFPAAGSASAHIDGRAFARAAAADGAVLLQNSGEILPWKAAGGAGRIAVIGQHAAEPRTQGGGSATVVPDAVVSPLDGIRSAYPQAEVRYELGAVVQDELTPLPLAALTNPVTGEAGVRVRFLAAGGEELFVEDRFSTSLVWFGGGDAPVDRSAVMELSFLLDVGDVTRLRLGFAAAGRSRVHVDGELVLDDTVVPEGDDLGAAFLSPPSSVAVVDVLPGRRYAIRAEYLISGLRGTESGMLAYTLGLQPPPVDPAELRERAVDAARSADLAVVVVGTTARVESEGYDRQTLALPEGQDALVSAVAAANPRTLVVVNAGAPVLMPWRDQVAGILLVYFPGQEFGSALGDLLTGRVEPGGRLPTTWPAAEADVPVLDVTPRDGVLAYREDIHLGYRGWLRDEREPAFEFGHGLGYTTWRLDELRVEIDDTGGAVASLAVANTGARRGKHVVQLYAERADGAVERPVRWLVGFAVIRLEAGERRLVEVRLDRRAFQHWDGGWRTEPGAFTIRAGASVGDLPLARTVDLPPAPAPLHPTSGFAGVIHQEERRT